MTDETATYTFEYGTSQSYGSSASMPGSSSVGGTATLASLLPETTYYYCIHATDASNNTSSSCDSFTTAPTPDTTSSIISGIANESLLSTSTKIVWVTDEPAYSKVRYGTTESLGQETTPNTTAELLHETTITGLTPSTKYYFCIDATDNAGNKSDSCGNTFTTAAQMPVQDTNPPVVSSLSITNITTTSAKVTWKTDEGAKTQVEYGLTLDYGSTTRLNRNFDLNHSVNLYRLKPFTLYHYRVKSTDRAGNVSTSADEIFTTLAISQSVPVPSSVDGASESGAVRAEVIRDYRSRSSDLQQKISALPNTAVASVPMPVLFGVGLKNISPNFGDPRPGGRTHEGEDIMAVKGTPIVSPTAAIVLRTDVGASEGNAIYTANPGGETFVYMHLDRYGEGVVPGLVLQRGSLIGYVGNTGNASGGAAHLHFEIHNSSGTPMDPYPRLTSELTLQEKIADLFTILNQTSSSATLAQFLVLNFRSTFTAALASGIALPPVISNYLTSLPVTAASTSTRTLRVGSVGEDVKWLQGALGGLTVDGSFGPKTKAALILFQTAHGLVADGIFGPRSRAALVGSSPTSATGAVPHPGCNGTAIYSITTGLKC